MMRAARVIGRPRRIPGQESIERLEVRLTEDERARVAAAATRIGLSVSDFVRLALRREFCPDESRRPVVRQ